MSSGSYRKLLFQYEALRAQLEIREHYLKTVVKEVYENIGQVLSLIRVQLSLLRTDFETGKEESIESSGELVGKTIRDLRKMCQLFQPEADIISEQGFFRTFQQEVKTAFPKAGYHIEEKNFNLPFIKNENGLILFGLLLEILNLIRGKKKGQLNSVSVKLSGNKLNIVFDYSGEIIKRNKSGKQGDKFELSVFERAELMGGRIEIKNKAASQRLLKLVIPFN